MLSVRTQPKGTYNYNSNLCPLARPLVHLHRPLPYHTIPCSCCITIPWLLLHAGVEGASATADATTIVDKTLANTASIVSATSTVLATMVAIILACVRYESVHYLADDGNVLGS